MLCPIQVLRLYLRGVEEVVMNKSEVATNAAQSILISDFVSVFMSLDFRHDCNVQ